jgi:hypothetical protein
VQIRSLGMNDDDSGQQILGPLPEAIEMRLREAAAKHDAPCPLRPRDLVRPLRDGGLSSSLQIGIVLSILPESTPSMHIADDRYCLGAVVTCRVLFWDRRSDSLLPYYAHHADLETVESVR